MGNMKRGVYTFQTKENLGKHEIRNGNYTKSSSTKSINHSTVNQNNLTIYHQNIRGIINKTEELLLSFTSELPHVLCIVCVYRAPSGDFLYFIQNLEDFLNKLYRNSKNILICGDVNIKYFINNSYKQQLDSLMASWAI
jgi:hypothetical protein